jgi:hypothetical protein
MVVVPNAEIPENAFKQKEHLDKIEMIYGYVSYARIERKDKLVLNIKDNKSTTIIKL